MKEMSTKQVVDLLLTKETEISNKFHQAISEILRLGYNSERGKNKISDLISSVEYSLEEIERKIDKCEILI